ncbi:MAG: alcohol dehydrogenase catalytic domain-containing protein [bacterium]|nr:alcohol dehydrogenase catalytic domain-containing protein [bacterium]
MPALLFDGTLKLENIPVPKREENEILIEVRLAGICNTDHEITRGYVPGFDGIPGHEFIGIVKEADDHSLIGKRCTAEINCACGKCPYCRQHLQRHCPNRTVLGIINRNGCFAKYVTVPKENLTLIPESIPDSNAVFIEPLAAALEILEQIEIRQTSNVLLLGDGKLGLMIGHVLASTGCQLTVVGNHPEKLALLNYLHIAKISGKDFKKGKYDIVIEATGNPATFNVAVENTKPRGTIIMKSTYAGNNDLNLSAVVVNEITLIGSRCGLFSKAVDFLQMNDISFENMINGEYPITDALNAFEASKRPGALKVLLRME